MRFVFILYPHTTINSLKTGLKRLVDKGIIAREPGKRGVGGVIQFSTSTNIKNKLLTTLSDDLKSNDINIESNSYIYNSNITTINKNNKKEEDQSNSTKPINQTQKIESIVTEYSSEWDNLDLSPLESNGMKKSHIQQLKNIEGLTPDMVQESINHYSWALDNDPERMKRYAQKQNQLKGLMGCLKKGNPWTEGEYIDPIEEAMQKSIEAQKKRIERLKAQKEEMFNLEYEEWEMGLTIEEKTDLKKKLNIVTMRGGGYKAQMRTYFRDNIYKG